MQNLPDPELLPEFYAWVPLKRLVAWLVDSLLILLLSFVVVVATALFALPLAPLIYLALNIAFRTVTLTRWSATPGMALMAVELRRRDGRRLDRGTALLHTLTYTGASLTVVLQIASVAMMLTSPRGQGLPDTLLGTVALNRPSGG